MATRAWVPEDAGAAELARYSLKSRGSGGNVTVSGSSVAALLDLGPSQRTMGQYTTHALPAYTASGLNGFPTAHFTQNSGTGLRSSSCPGLMNRSGGYTVIALLRSQNNAIYGEFDYTDSGYSNQYSGIRDYNDNGTSRLNVYLRTDGGSTSTSYEIGGGANPANWHILVFRDHVTYAEVSFDGGPYRSVNYTRPSGTFTPGYFSLGSMGPFDATDMDLAEILFFDGTVNDTTDRAVGYLAWDWGPPGSATDLVANLSANNPYKAAAPTVTTGGTIAARRRPIIVM